jgi:hypothetical protein
MRTNFSLDNLKFWSWNWRRIAKEMFSKFSIEMLHRDRQTDRKHLGPRLAKTCIRLDVTNGLQRWSKTSFLLANSGGGFGCSASRL